jgi:hypothetical protein
LSLFLFEGDKGKVVGVRVRVARRFDFDIGEGEGEDIRSLLLTEPLVGVDCAFCGVEIFDRLSSKLKSFTIAQASRISLKY